MTRIIITLLITIISLLGNAQESKQETISVTKGVDITVVINKIANNKGKVYFTIFNSKDSFYKREFFQRVTGEIIDNKTEIVFKNIPEGIYAIICFHDANNNNQMDFENSMPIEDYGTSNNPMLMGPPQFQASKFEVNNNNLSLEIKF